MKGKDKVGTAGQEMNSHINNLVIRQEFVLFSSTDLSFGLITRITNVLTFHRLVIHSLIEAAVRKSAAANKHLVNAIASQRFHFLSFVY